MDNSTQDSESILANFGRKGKFRPGNRNKGNNRGKGSLVTKVQLRKAQRKQSRKDKKAGKHRFLLSKSEKSKLGSENPKIEQKQRTKHDKKESKPNPKLQNKTLPSKPLKTKKSIPLSTESDLKKEENELKKDMEGIRHKRLMEDNEAEDRYINQLRKKLKLNKKAAIPESFRTDGLDYLLEICDKNKPSKGKKGQDKVSDESDGSNDEDLSDDNQDSEENETNSDVSESSEQDDGDHNDFEDEESGESEDGDESGENEIGSESGESEKEDDQLRKVSVKKAAKKKQGSKKESEIWEDIYGRLRDKKGSVIASKPEKEGKAPTGAKYVPPMKRNNDSKRETILKTLKGLLNRLSEANMHRISQQIEELYMTNSRNEMNESMLEILCSSLVQSVTQSDRIILEHIMLIAILHANVGTEVGAFFIQNFVQMFRSKYDEIENLEDNKELQNLALLISYIYHFKIVDSALIYDILDFLANNFSPKDVELILTILRSVGFRLRKDNPASLKALILLLQQKATTATLGVISSRVKFMLEILIAIRNNNMNKIPNYDPSFGEHLLKILKVHLSKGNYISEMKISMKDLLNAETKGRWWIVGSAWSNEVTKNVEDSVAATVEKEKFNQELLAKAKAQGMNTELRKNIFCILMTAEDYLDAFEKLCRLGLKNQMEREIIFVIIYCCLQEKKFNAYYYLIAAKFCAFDRKHMYSSKFKLEAIEYAKLIGQRATSRFLEVAQRRIFEWMRCWQKIMEEVEPSFRSHPLSTNTIDFDNILQFVTPTAITEKCNLTGETELVSSVRRSTRVKKAAATFIPSKETENNESEMKYNTNTGEIDEAIEIDEPAQLDCGDKSAKGSSMSSRRLKQILDAGIESDVYNWVQSLLPSKATSSQIRNKARQLYREKGYTKIQCSYGWYRRWTERFQLNSDPHGDTDPAILVWLLQQYDNNIQVSYADLQKYAQTIVTKYKTNFKASKGWAMRFFKRHHLFVNWDGFFEDDLPPVLQNKVEEYLMRLRNNVIPGFPLNRIGCLDEIPLSFSATGCNNIHSSQPLSFFPPATNADEDVSEMKMPRARKITVKNCDVTVILALTASGFLLPPMILLKDDKNNVNNRAFILTDKPVVVFYSDTTEPTQIVLRKWMDTVWIPNVPYGPPSLLLLDSYDQHRLVSEQFEALSVNTEIFPEGAACKLQPLGVFVKVAFLKSMEEHWLNYLKENRSGQSTSLPSTNEVINWIYDTYVKMTSENYDRLKESFWKVGLLNEAHLTG